MFDNVRWSTSTRARSAATRQADVLDAIEFVGLEVAAEGEGRHARRRERRLVEVARAVVGKPRLVLLDEPAAGLPDEETEHLGEVIRSIPEQIGALVILVDHDMSLVSACCETTAVLDFGKLIASGPTAEVLRERARDPRLPRHRGGAVTRGDWQRACAADRRPVRRPRRAQVAARRVARDPARRGHRAARPERRRQVDARARGRAACCGRRRARRCSATATSPGAGPRRSAQPASRSCPRAGGCCRS